MILTNLVLFRTWKWRTIYSQQITKTTNGLESVFVCVCDNVSEHVCDWQWAIALWRRVIERVWTVLWERLHYSVLVKRSLIFVQISALHTLSCLSANSRCLLTRVWTLSMISPPCNRHWHKQQRAAMFVHFLDVRDNSGQTCAWHDINWY